MFEINKNGCFCWGLNPFETIKVSLLRDSYCFITCRVVFEQSSNTIGTQIDPLLVNQMETEGSNRAIARKGGGKSFAKSFLNCSRKTLVLQSFLSGCDRSHPPLWGNFFPDVLYIPSEQEINFLTWIFGIWSLTDFFALGDFLAPFQTYWLQSLLENAPAFTRVNNKFLRGWKNTNCSLMKGWLTPEWAKVKNGFSL